MPSGMQAVISHQCPPLEVDKTYSCSPNSNLQFTSAMCASAMALPRSGACSAADEALD